MGPIKQRKEIKQDEKSHYGTEENNTRVYYGAAAQRDFCVWQQSQWYAWRWSSLYCSPQVWGHHGAGRGSAGTELRHSDDAGWGRNHPSVCGRIHPVCQGTPGPDVPRDPHRMRYSWLHRRGDCSAVREGSRRGEYRAAS